MSDIRDTITKELRWNFFGPDHTDSEEELLHLNRLEREDPGRVYITGLLSPQLNTTEDEESQDDSPFSKTGANDSSFGLTFCLPNNFSGKVEYGVDFSHYENEKIDEVETFIRKPHTHVFSFDLDMIKEGNKIENEVFKIDKKEHEIKLILTRRTDISNPSGIMFTLSIVHFGKVESSLRPWRSTLFHVRVWTRYKDGKFSELPFQSLDLTEDKKRASLLYRNVHRFAVGHGCGVNWNSSAPVNEIESTFFPEVEVPLYKHADLETEALSMIKWAGVGMDFELLKNIPDSYSKWLDSQERISENLPNDLLLTFQKNKKEVEYVLTRIKKGIDIIIGNPLAQKAFLWMNYVMLSQQIRSKLKVIPVVNENGDPTPGNSLDFDVLDMDSWPIENKERLGRWRLFQMAFILMCIPDIVEDEKEPNMDLIWFPTGGGKTEAYLGLSAFLLLYERLTGKNNKGVRVIMRYTLRLLTAQQFERAAAMILALDDLRFSNSSELGDVPFQIGLWVGGAVTFNKNGSIPNNWTREVTTANQWYSNLNYQYPNRSWPWVLQKCPRCSREFGVKGKGDNKKAFGISRTNENKVIYSCECSNYKNNRLPIVVIDEDIYEELPAIVIATVDKFARLSWNSLSSKILGVNALGDKKHSQVSMIIQDELHLLEGPLGTIVGLYETAIDRLIQRTGANPKRIGSSATLAMAHEQCNSLYGLPPENVKIFPPPLLNWDDNYFSYVEKGVDGRKYVGVYANGSPSHKTTQYRLFSSLQQSGGKAAIEDPINNESFSTLVNYFNSTKDMGHALSLMGDDVPREMRNLFRRFNIPKDKRRSSIDINLGLVQLHGNIDSDTVQRDMSRLLIPYNNKGHVHTVLATNMISVGLDVPRLSLMTIQHQPKTMSEYIQASSRIGRGKTPGVVYVVLSALRSRDRSHLEDFKHTHEKMYSLVEPSSLTPFSTSALERALAGVLVAIFRNDPMEGHFGEFAPLKQKHIKDVREFYIKRVSAVDKKELNNFLEKFDSFCRSWNRDGYRSFGKERNINLANSPLMVPFLTPMDVRNSKPYQVLSAMRNVDSGIELKQMQ